MEKISVIGFGKIGQAIAANILANGIPVTAIDTDTGIRQQFAEGNWSTKEPGLTGLLNEAYRDKQLDITNRFSAAGGSKAVIVAIPLLIDAEKKLLEKPFLAAFEALAPFLSDKIPVIIETSLPVGFSRDRVVPVMESAGKKHGTDYLLAHSPERIKSGTMMEQLRQIPKVVGGIDDHSLDAAVEVYRCFFDEHLIQPVESIEAAEMVKLAGMIYRDVNIALSNQLAQFADARGIRFADLISLINTDKEADLLFPGIGVGGHCTPVYPYFLIENFRQSGLQFSMAAHSREINDGMAEYAVSLILDKVQERKALVLGLSFRPNVKEDALSTAYLVRDVLLRSGFQVGLHDVEFSTAEISSRQFNPVADIYESGAEVIFLVTMHKEYYGLDFKRLYASGARFFVDGRNLVDRSEVERAGICYHGIGR
jgi:nucleotide sugar dehydrogenase